MNRRGFLTLSTFCAVLPLLGIKSKEYKVAEWLSNNIAECFIKSGANSNDIVKIVFSDDLHLHREGLRGVYGFIKNKNKIFSSGKNKSNKIGISYDWSLDKNTDPKKVAEYAILLTKEKLFTRC
jgi:hypothetical protein